MAALSVNIATAHIFLLHILFHSGSSTGCPGREPNLFITTPQKMEALSGSCLQIPCNFTSRNEGDFDKSRNILALWFKEYPGYSSKDPNVVFNSQKTDNIYPMEITGDLRLRNCTTLFSNLIKTHADTYYFRIENNPYKATADCDPLQITVNDSAPRPRLEIPGDLKEDQSVSITCSAPTPCPQSPPQLTWSLQQDPHNIMEENPDGTFTTKIQETLTLSEKHDGHNISCSARYPVDGGDVRTSEETMTLSVSYAPRDTSVSISPSGPVSVGSRVELSCSSRAKPPVSSYTWFKKSRGGDTSVSEGQVYSFNVTQGGVYYCVATNDLGNGTSDITEIHLKSSDTSSLSGELVGGIIGVFLLLCLVLCVCIFMYRRRSKSADDPPQRQNQSHSGVELAALPPEGQPDEGDIHYGEIDFSKRTHDPSSSSVQDSGAQQETLYAQVKVSTAANSINETEDVPEDLYAQVREK